MHVVGASSRKKLPTVRESARQTVGGRFRPISTAQAGGALVGLGNEAIEFEGSAHE